MKFVSQSYYEILDIDPVASEEGVKRAYRMVRSSFEPESMAIYSLYSPEETEAIGAKIDEAFRFLTNRDRRRTYDKYLDFMESDDPAPEEPDGFYNKIHDIHELAPLEEFIPEAADEPAACAQDEDSDEYESVEVSAEVQIEMDLDFGPVEADPVQEFDVSLERFVDGPQPEDLSAEEIDCSAEEEETEDEVSYEVPAEALPVVPLQPQVSVFEKTVEMDNPSTPRLRAWSREMAGQRPGEAESLELQPLTPEALGQVAQARALSGQELRTLRQQRGIPLETISERTKISIMYLRFIEQDRYADLPAPIYLKGFVDQYAQLLQLPRELVDRYMVHYQQNCG